MYIEILNYLKNKILNLIKQSTIILVDDTGNVQTANVSFFGKIQKAISWKPYGLVSNPPVNSLSLSFNSNGQESNMFVIADDPNNRPKGYLPGEVGLSNYLQATQIKLDNTGQILLIANTVTINGNVTISGDIACSNINCTNVVCTSVGNGLINLVTHTHTDSVGGTTTPPQAGV